MTYRINHPHTVTRGQVGPILLSQAISRFLKDTALTNPERARELLYSLDDYLGLSAPLLAYTKLTGEAWRRTLDTAAQAEAETLLREFRGYLREHGWLDAARPVNQLD